MEYAESEIAKIKKSYAELKKLFDLFRASQEGDSQGGKEANMELLKNLEEELNKLKNEFLMFRDDTFDNMKSLQDGLNKKADRDELVELEARIMDKLNEIIKNLLA